ncbi:aminoglycoside 3'-phosphotransferase [Nocardioides lijunqiniae]|uniref:aminoglycoside 3'-phosphotransferase n=1 Tax=Nocardioides lijunqiniae TaxID=2760832 RepID=UPI001878B360|nr:aminoglycoside 3'-phosphotransferase [Nocardioides lijunqiniae]
MVNGAEPHGLEGPDDTEAAWNRRFRTLEPGEDPAPILQAILRQSAAADPVVPDLVWRNQVGGQTWRIGDRYVKWSPRTAGIDLGREVERLRWLEGRHPAARVLGAGDDGTGQWMVTAALHADSVVSECWRAEPEQAVRAIAVGLRRLHALPLDAVPRHWLSWASRASLELGPRPPVEDPVLVHGDACAPNTLVDSRGSFAAHVDVGDLAVADRWADLAIGAMSLEWNYGPGWDGLFFEVYGIAPDAERIAYYRALWDSRS